MKDFYRIATINNDGTINTTSYNTFDTEEEAKAYLETIYDTRRSILYPEPNGMIVVQKVSTIYIKHEPSTGECKCGKYKDKRWPTYIPHERAYHATNRCYETITQEVDLIEEG
jgi:hypothetical protein